MRVYLFPLLVISACSSTMPRTNASVDMAMTGGNTPACLPSGYTALAFASSTPVRTFSKADPSLTSGKDYVAVVETDAGCILIDLYETQTPITVNSFVFLALHRFFEGIAYHRVIDGFVAQAGDANSVDGDPSTWGSGELGYSFGLEVTPTLNYDRAGVLGMARTSDPNSNGSQFFITLAATANLNQKYTIFGAVQAGLDVLPKIVRGEPPSTPTRIKTVTIAIK